MAEASGFRQVMIVGGGFAGLFAARALARAPDQVTLLDRAEHHLFQPMLYQCATCEARLLNLAWSDVPAGIIAG